MPLKLDKTITDSLVKHILTGRYNGNIPLLLLYVPFGIVLFILRLFYGFHVMLISLILPWSFQLKHHLLRICFLLLGIRLKADGSLPPNTSLIVSNKTSPLDHVLLSLLFTRIHSTAFMEEMSQVEAFLFGIKFLVKRTDFSKFLLSNEGFPLLIQPEFRIVPSMRAMYRFKHEHFHALQKVTPIAITVSRPLLLQCSCFRSSKYLDLLLYLFVPITNVSVKILPSVEKSDTEGSNAFLFRISEAIAKAGELEILPFDEVDCEQYMKQYNTKVAAHQSPGKFLAAISAGNDIKSVHERYQQMLEEERSKYLRRKDLD